jgi:peptidoglycan/LPS O-acetylase OafA/YrhL
MQRGENSYFSRFFVKFIEVSAAGLASAICAYLLAHFVEDSCRLPRRPPLFRSARPPASKPVR